MIKRSFIAILAFSSVCFGKEWKPNEVEISIHRSEVYELARNYVIETFNIEVLEEGVFNPVRFDSRGVWGNFETRIKDLGGDRFEVKGWVNARGYNVARAFWTVHIRYELPDPEAWRYSRIDEVIENKPEFLGWKLDVGTDIAYSSRGYSAEYDPVFLSQIYRQH